MIETIYSNENGDVNSTGKSQAAFRMPKNIRQVGKSNAIRKIYIEDYVMSYIKQLSGGEYSECSIAVLVGQCVKLENSRNIFISGAVKVNDANAINDITFTNDTWTAIYEDIKKYFVEAEIVGWFIGGAGYLFTEEDKIQKTHIDNFAGQDRVLLTYDNLEKEETFLCYENNRLCKQEGYYIYYEKNDEMQTYIIDHKKGGSCEEDYDDKVSKDIRTVIQNKQTQEEDSKGVTRLMYAAGTLLAVIVLIIGAAMLRNYDQMKNMQDTLNHLSKNMQKEPDNATGSDASDQSKKGQAKSNITAAATKSADKASSSNGKGQDSLDVEVERGNVDPIKKEEDKSSTASQTGKSSVTSKGSDKEDTSDKELASDKSTSNKTPTSKPKPSSKPTANQSTKEATTYYTVKNGDTLADISYKLYSTYTQVKKIMTLNGITDQDLIYEGQKLIVPKK